MRLRHRHNIDDTKSKRSNPRTTKKEQIVSLFLAGIDRIEDLAMITRSRPSYVASVLQAEGLITGYFDLYTSAGQPMNVYSKYFANKLGFRDIASARESIEYIGELYQSFDRAGDRAGQHHALVMALTMFDRARWTSKYEEAEVFRKWLLDRFNEMPEHSNTK